MVVSYGQIFNRMRPKKKGMVRSDSSSPHGSTGPMNTDQVRVPARGEEAPQREDGAEGAEGEPPKDGGEAEGARHRGEEQVHPGLRERPL